MVKPKRPATEFGDAPASSSGDAFETPEKSPKAPDLGDVVMVDESVELKRVPYKEDRLRLSQANGGGGI